MTADIVPLKPVETEPYVSVIEVLEHMLAEAREGTISAVALAYVRPDRTTGSAFSDCDGVGLMLGAVSRLMHRINVELDEE